MAKRQWLNDVATLVFLLFSGVLSLAYAQEAAPQGQLQFRTGPISGSFSGPTDGEFSVTLPLDFAYEHFLGPRSSWLVRTILAHDSSEGRTAYAYSGIGFRGYFWSRGPRVESGIGGESIQIQPNRRYYYGLDLGISQVLLKSVGSVLEIRTSMIDFGPQVGVIQQMSKNIGLELHLGYTMGMGFSSVTASGNTMRTMLGLSYYY